MDFATFGGLDENGDLSNKVTLVDLDTGTSCLHSEFPQEMKEVFLFDYQKTIIACSSFTTTNRLNLKCFQWIIEQNKWKVVFNKDIKENGVFDFISAVRVPGNYIL